MTNYEKHKDSIIKSLASFSAFALFKGVPTSCHDIECEDCDFRPDEKYDSCIEKMRAWFNTEYVERPKLTKAERAFVESLHSDVCISRHPNMECIRLWRGSAQLYVRLVVDFYNINFPFIDSETKWSVEDLLKLEVQDD